APCRPPTGNFWRRPRLTSWRFNRKWMPPNVTGMPVTRPTLRLMLSRKKNMDDSPILINGKPTPVVGEHRLSLADFLRDSGINSVHLGCEHGVCGTCNVLVDGQCVRSCLALAHACTGSEVISLEGLQDDLAGRLRAAFTRHHALQCGYCTPGVFVAAYDLLAAGAPLEETQVRERLSGNICRCTGYQGIIDAVLDVAASLEADTQAAGEAA